jgi:hypothetical protein
MIQSIQLAQTLSTNRLKKISVKVLISTEILERSCMGEWDDRVQGFPLSAYYSVLLRTLACVSNPKVLVITISILVNRMFKQREGNAEEHA